MLLPKIACNAELAPKIVLLLVLATLVICGVLTLVSCSALVKQNSIACNFLLIFKHCIVNAHNTAVCMCMEPDSIFMLVCYRWERRLLSALITALICVTEQS